MGNNQSKNNFCVLRCESFSGELFARIHNKISYNFFYPNWIFFPYKCQNTLEINSLGFTVKFFTFITRLTHKRHKSKDTNWFFICLFYSKFYGGGRRIVGHTSLIDGNCDLMKLSQFARMMKILSSVTSQSPRELFQLRNWITFQPHSKSHADLRAQEFIVRCNLFHTLTRNDKNINCRKRKFAQKPENRKQWHKVSSNHLLGRSVDRKSFEG